MEQETYNYMIVFGGLLLLSLLLEGIADLDSGLVVSRFFG